MTAPGIDFLLDLLDRAYNRPAWHGPNLRGAIRGLTPEVAAHRPGPGRKTIAEQVVHAAYWKYAVRRQLRGFRRGSFPLKGSNWFDVGGIRWAECVAILDSEHRLLRESVAEFPESRLHDPSPKKKYCCVDLIAGVTSHDIYHAGQIQLIRRLIS